jgi:uncharacterized Zn-binding protein involved in type VI secretion
MPGIVRDGDLHEGHTNTVTGEFHQTAYVAGQDTVLIEGRKVVLVGDTTSCGDPAVIGSSKVFVGGKAVHRVGDATGGHGNWPANAAQNGSDAVFCG